MSTPWPRTARLDAPRLIARLAETTGTVLTLEGPCPGGQAGAAYVRLPDGRPGLTAHVDGTTITVQQRLPGRPPSTIDEPLLTAMITMNARQAGLLRHHPQTPATDLYLTRSGPGFCLHETLAAHSRRTNQLLTLIHAIGAGTRTTTGDDLVHLDYHPGNILVSDGHITGVVDWTGASRGDRHLDLVTLRFDIARHTPHLLPVIDAQIDHDQARPWTAHMSLRLVDWAIRHHTPDDVDAWLTIAETALAR